ncbi:MAG: hypothetical protein SFU83_08625 [Meiothermus sp.]|nr:hypothetical protein [Meiothermus sp.]
MNRPLLLGVLVVLASGAAGWGWLHHQRTATESALVAPVGQSQEEKFEEFKQLCEYYLREEFKLPEAAPFPELSEREVRLLSSGYHTFFELPITDASGKTHIAQVGCEMNGWADRFVISTYY